MFPNSEVLPMNLDSAPSTAPQVGIGSSPWIFGREDAVLAVIDVQEKLLPLVLDSEAVLWNIQRLLDAASILGLPILGTEQYPKGLGTTVSPLKEKLGTLPEKMAFSCLGCSEFIQSLQSLGRTKVILVGIETHICVQQTALDLLANGFDVQIVVDGVSSRRQIDHTTALERMKLCGVFPTTTEAALFEWVRSAEAAEFKAISSIVRQAAP